MPIPRRLYDEFGTPEHLNQDHQIVFLRIDPHLDLVSIELVKRMKVYTKMMIPPVPPSLVDKKRNQEKNVHLKNIRVELKKIFN